MLRAPGRGAAPCRRGLCHQPWAAAARGAGRAGKRSAGIQKTRFVFSPAAASRHNREAKEGEASHHGTSGLAKGGKFSPRSSLTNVAQHRWHPAGDASPTAPQAAPGCRDLPSLGSGLWARAPWRLRDVQAPRGAEPGSLSGPPCTAARWGELGDSGNPWENLLHDLFTLQVFQCIGCN